MVRDYRPEGPAPCPTDATRNRSRVSRSQAPIIRKDTAEMPCRIRRNILKPVANSMLAHLPWPTRYESPTARGRPRSTDAGWTQLGKPDPTSATARHGRIDPTVVEPPVHHNHGATPHKLVPSPTAAGIDLPTPSSTARPPSPTAAPVGGRSKDDLWPNSLETTKSGIHHNHGATPHKLGPTPTTATPIGDRTKDDVWPNSLRPTKSGIHHNHGATPHKLGPSPSAAENYRTTPSPTAAPVGNREKDELWANSLRPSTVASHYRLSATARPETWVDIDA